MKAETEEWIARAEEDFSSATALFRLRTRQPKSNVICFLCQQTTEKYLKARMAEAGLEIPRVHDLVLLVQRLLPVEPLWDAFAPTLRYMNDYAVKFRYPGHIATRTDARTALKTCRSIRAEIRLSLKLPKK